MTAIERRVARRQVRYVSGQIERHRGLLQRMERDGTAYSVRAMVARTIHDLERELLDWRRQAVGMSPMPGTPRSPLERTARFFR